MLLTLKWEISEDDFYFTQTKNTYYADYRPKYPERTNGDFLIAYDWIKGKRTISQGYESNVIPTVIELNEDLERVE